MERGRQSRVTGRQTEVPLRVQDTNRQSMMYTTPQRSQLSLGKLNVPKPSSVTSERRTSFFGRRTSTMGTFGGAEKIKDTRPLHDKSYVQQCIRQLHEFLTEYGYTGPLSAKTLQSPSTKEFVKMFEFIYCQLEPTFVMPNLKIEEEIPAMLKSIGYPFVLSKSSMYSVGAPHTWPMALGALMWLIDNVKILENLNDHKTFTIESCGDRHDVDEDIDYNKLFQDYTAESYYKFMHNNDTFEEEDEAFTAKLRKLYNVDEALLSTLEEKYRMVSEELEQLEKESQSDRLMSKRLERTKLQKDLKQLQHYSSSLDSFKSNLESKSAELENELQNAVSQLEILKHDYERLHLQLQEQNQKFTAADVERINREKRELQLTLSSLTKTLEEAEQHKWNEEIALAKAKEREEAKLSEYHKVARKLQLIPVSAKNACGHDFEISQVNCGSGSAVQHNTETQIRLRKLISDVEEENSQSAHMRLSLEASCEQVTSNLLDKLNDLKQLREQIGRLDEQLDSRMQELDQDEQGWAEEIESVENHRKQLEKNINHGYDEAMQQLKTAQQQYHLVLQETAEERRIVTKNLAAVFTTATNHLEVTEKSMEDLHSRMRRIRCKSVEEDEAAMQRLQEAWEDFSSKAEGTLN